MLLSLRNIPLHRKNPLLKKLLLKSLLLSLRNIPLHRKNPLLKKLLLKSLLLPLRNIPLQQKNPLLPKPSSLLPTSSLVARSSLLRKNHLLPAIVPTVNSTLSRRTPNPPLRRIPGPLQRSMCQFLKVNPLCRSMSCSKNHPLSRLVLSPLSNNPLYRNLLQLFLLRKNPHLPRPSHRSRLKSPCHPRRLVLLVRKMRRTSRPVFRKTASRIHKTRSQQNDPTS